MVNPPAGTPYAPYPPTAPAPPMIIQVQTSGKAIAAMVLGICAMCLPYVGLIAAPLAIVFALLAMKEINRNPQTIKGKGMALTGLILGIIAAVLYILVIAIFGFAFNEIQKCLADPDAPGCEDFQQLIPPEYRVDVLAASAWGVIAPPFRRAPRLVAA